MPKFKAGDGAVYCGKAYPKYVGKIFIVADTRDIFVNNAIKLKELPESGYWNPDVFKIYRPISLENK